MGTGWEGEEEEAARQQLRAELSVIDWEEELAAEGGGGRMCLGWKTYVSLLEDVCVWAEDICVIARGHKLMCHGGMHNKHKSSPGNRGKCT